MIRSVITHASLLAVLVHLHWGGCAYHLPACEQQAAAAPCHHGHDHGPADDASLPIDLPVHDDCHESHSSAALSQALVAPAPDSEGCVALAIVLRVATADAHFLGGVAISRADEYPPLPLRAYPRSQALLN